MEHKYQMIADRLYRVKLVKKGNHWIAIGLTAFTLTAFTLGLGPTTIDAASLLPWRATTPAEIAPRIAPTDQTYTFRAGDTLWALAQVLGIDYHTLMEWNGLHEGDQYHIPVGTVVKIRGNHVTMTTPDGRKLIDRNLPPQAWRTQIGTTNTILWPQVSSGRSSEPIGTFGGLGTAATPLDQGSQPTTKGDKPTVSVTPGGEVPATSASGSASETPTSGTDTPVTSGDKPTSSATLGGEVPATSASGAAGETPTSGTDTPATSGNNSTTSVTPGGEVPATSASGSASETPTSGTDTPVTSGDKPTSSATLGGEAPATSASGAAGETPTSGTDTPVTSGDNPTTSATPGGKTPATSDSGTASETPTSGTDTPVTSGDNPTSSATPGGKTPATSDSGTASETPTSGTDTPVTSGDNPTTSVTPGREAPATSDSSTASETPTSGTETPVTSGDNPTSSVTPGRETPATSDSSTASETPTSGTDTPVTSGDNPTTSVTPGREAPATSGSASAGETPSSGTETPATSGDNPTTSVTPGREAPTTSDSSTTSETPTSGTDTPVTSGDNPTTSATSGGKAPATSASGSASETPTSGTETPVTSGDNPTSSATLGGEVPATSASGAAGETPTSGTDTPATSGNNSTTSVTPGGEVPATSASGSASETPTSGTETPVTSGDKPTSSATLGGEAPATSASGAAGETPTSGTDTPVTSGDKPTSSATLGGEAPATSASGAAGETPTSGTDTPVTSGDKPTSSATSGGEAPATSGSTSAGETPTSGTDTPATSASGSAGETPTSGTDTPATSGDNPTSGSGASGEQPQSIDEVKPTPRPQPKIDLQPLQRRLLTGQNVMTTAAYYNADAAKQLAYRTALAAASQLQYDPQVTAEQMQAAIAQIDTAQATLDGQATDFKAATILLKRYDQRDQDPRYHNATTTAQAPYDEAVAALQKLMTTPAVTQAMLDAAVAQVEATQAKLDGAILSPAEQAKVDAINEFKATVAYYQTALQYVSPEYLPYAQSMLQFRGTNVLPYLNTYTTEDIQKNQTILKQSMDLYIQSSAQQMQGRRDLEAAVTALQNLVATRLTLYNEINRVNDFIKGAQAMLADPDQAYQYESQAATLQEVLTSAEAAQAAADKLIADNNVRRQEALKQLMAEQVPGTSTYVQYADEHYKLTTTLKKVVERAELVNATLPYQGSVYEGAPLDPEYLQYRTVEDYLQVGTPAYDQLVATVDRLKGQLQAELEAGRGGQDAINGDVTKAIRTVPTDADVAALKPLLNLADAYSQRMLKSVNLMRFAIGERPLELAPLNDKRKAMLAVHALAEYQAGLMPQFAGYSHLGSIAVLLAPHTMTAGYNENTYPSGNPPVISQHLTPEYLADMESRLVLMEGIKYFEGFFTDKEAKSGHFTTIIDMDHQYFYGVPIIGTMDQVGNGFTKYRISSTGLFYQVADDNYKWWLRHFDSWPKVNPDTDLDKTDFSNL
nr:LysM peptidoglycan-binding domain-containing protein [Limosilactobacillus reuteri]